MVSGKGVGGKGFTMPESMRDKGVENGAEGDWDRVLV